MCYILMEHQCVCILIEHERVKFYGAAEFLYSSRATVCLLHSKGELMCSYSYGASVFNILMAHQCVIFLLNIRVFIFLC